MTVQPTTLAHEPGQTEGHACMSRRAFLLAGGAVVTLAALPGVTMALEALKADYPAQRIARLSDMVTGEPISFNYPYPTVRNMLVKMGEPAGGGIGAELDVVAFNLHCPHQGGPLDGSYKHAHQMLGPCPLHLTTFDLTRHGMVVSGHATQSLPQIVLELRGDDIYATGVLGLIFGYSANLAGRRI